MTNDYISRKWLEEFKNMPRFSSPRAKMYQRLWNEVIEAILEDAPPVDVKPVRHGRWVKRTGGALGYDCTVCGKSEVSNHFDYCPNCGARMDDEEDG